MWLMSVTYTGFQLLEAMLMCWLLFFIMSSGPLFKLFMVLMMAIQFVWMISVNISSWWSLMLFLVYISGMLIAFAYFTAFSAKESFFLDLKLSFGILLLVLLTGTDMLLFSYQEMTETWVLSNSMIFVLLGIFLLYILILSCMMCFKKKMPLRPFLI